MGFEGPFSGGKHQFLMHDRRRLTLPTNSQYSVPQLKMMIQEVEAILEREVTFEEWEGLA